MTNQVIPAEAVEAAAKVLDPQTMGSGGPLAEKFKEETRAEARAALEAAAPYMLAVVITTTEELDSLPVGSVVRSDMGVVWEKDEYTEEPELPWWCSTGDPHQYPARRISLPATLIYRPTP